MVNKFDLKTQVWRTGTASLSTDIGGQIPVGKKRFLTFIRVERLASGGFLAPGTNITNIEIAVASHTSSTSDLADDYTGTMVENAKLIVKMASLTTGGALFNLNNRMLKNEVKGTIENPILSVAGGNYMILGRPEGASASVFAQYFDA